MRGRFPQVSVADGAPGLLAAVQLATCFEAYVGPDGWSTALMSKTLPQLLMHVHAQQYIHITCLSAVAFTGCRKV